MDPQKMVRREVIKYTKWYVKERGTRILTSRDEDDRRGKVGPRVSGWGRHRSE